MKYLVDRDTIPNPVRFKEYLLSQENLVLQCLNLENQSLKPVDIKSIVPGLAKYWKFYVNMPQVALADQKTGIVHCASWIRFGRLHKFAEDYRNTMLDKNQVRISELSLDLSQSIPTLEDMVLVRDLR